MKGQLTIIDLYECDEVLVRDKSTLENFFKEICEVIKMNAWNSPIIKKFGKGDLRGYTGVQLIETSNITVHMDEFENKVFIDIFSCKDFDAHVAEKFSKNFFKAKKSNGRTIMRK